MNERSQRIANLPPEKRALLEQALVKRASQAASRPTFHRRDPAVPAQLSFGQQRLWFLDQLEPDSHLFTIAAARSLAGPLDVAALRATLNTIVARHEVLRTTFRLMNGEPVPVISTSSAIELPADDLSALPMLERANKVKHILEEAAHYHFDLSRERPFRAKLLRLANDEHILLTIWHHIASDAWSAAVFEHELSRLYAAYVLGKPSPLSELPIQYADFALWQRQRLQGPLLEAQLAYWRQQLAGSPAALDLPTDRPRPHVQSYAGALHVTVLPPALHAALGALARDERVTLFMLLLAAFKVLLYRYSGQTDLLVGIPIAGRQSAETEPLIGLFLNTLVLRNDLSGDPTFRELLSRVRSTSLAAYAHQDLPFERLVEELRVERDLSRTPLFQVMFNMRSAARPPLELPGLTVKQLVIESNVAQYDLSLAVMERGAELRLETEYCTDLFDHATIVRMLEHYEILLRAIIADPDQPISRLPILGAAERDQLFVAWNDTRMDYPKEYTIHQLVAEQVARMPDAAAVIFDNHELTYGELDRQANQLGHHLQQIGVEPGVLVGLCVERSQSMLITLLAILKTGAAYLPLDPEYPQERLAFMLADAQVPVLVSQTSLLTRLPTYGGHVVDLDADRRAIRQAPATGLGVPTSPDAVAYVIYTSGSTGQPKGVQIPHRAVVNFLLSMRHRPGLTGDDTLLAVTTLSFDIAALELLLPLIVGARVVIAPREVVTDGERLVHLMATVSPTVMQATPATWNMLLEAGWPGDPHLRILCGGEALLLPLARTLLSRSQALWNMYGPTETTIWSTVARVTGEQERITIGRPIHNTELYVLDAHLQAVPIGVPGELYIGGAGLALGYLNRPELTADRFVPHPFSTETAARLYDTGDLVRYLANGELEWLGRIDTQMKVRGFRIEAGEIEAVFRASPDIADAVVVVREDLPGDQRLVAYVVTSVDRASVVTKLGTLLQTKLPAYMLPSDIVTLDALPLTPAGKVDRRALPAPHVARAAVADTLMPPADPLELQLMLHWERLLGRKPIGVEDNFFEIGGHSLLAVRLFAQIEQQFGRRWPLATLFQAPTIAGLAAVLRQQGWSPPWSSLVAVQPGGTQPPFFWVPPAGVTALCFADLARHLGPDQPLYAFQAVGLDDDQPPETTVEEIAAHYLKEIRTLQPAGPYFLGGRCFGASVAFEMGRQLRRAGEEVALLVLNDPSSPAPFGTHEYLQRLRYFYSHGRLPAVLLRLFQIRWRMLQQRFDREVSSHMEPAQVRRIQRVLDTSLRAYRRYRGHTYRGPVTIIWSSESYATLGQFWQRWWEQVIDGDVTCRVAPGRHRTFLYEPTVQRFAAQLRTSLAELKTVPEVVI